MVTIKRVYDPPVDTDGRRILVDRLWPRGLSKPGARVDLWLKDVAPSAELRKWFAHDPARWPEFQARYRRELAGKPDLLKQLRAEARSGKVTLLYAARDEQHNNAAVLRSVLR